ncbi:MAG: hypothetical protein AAF871_15765 [Pseudomonadota bacterium]
MSDQSNAATSDLMPAKIIYALYVVSFIIGISSIAGVIYAYIARGKDPVLDSHLTFQINTFWIGLIVGIVGAVTIAVVIGGLILLGLAVWVILRIVTGFLLAHKGQPISGTKFIGAVAT